MGGNIRISIKMKPGNLRQPARDCEFPTERIFAKDTP